MGFFYAEKPASKSSKTKGGSKGSNNPYSKSLTELGCKGCSLNNARLKTPKMTPTGSSRPAIYILGAAPGEAEDEEGFHFAGKTGHFLRRQIPDRYEKLIRWNTTIRCKPLAGREPSHHELACCRKYQEDDIAETKPKVVLGLGPVPLEWIAGRYNDGSMRKILSYRGRRFPCNVKGHSFWYYPIADPLYILKKGSERTGEEWQRLFRNDIINALKNLDTLPKPRVEDPDHYYDGVEYLRRPEDIAKVLKKASKWEATGIDIETNGLRPFFKNKKILTLAISNVEATYVFPISHPGAKFTASQQRQVKDLVKDYLLTAGTKFWAHNSKFEQEWLSEELGDEIVFECEWHDTMAQAYILDEREGCKGLDDITLLHFGFDVKKLSEVDVRNLENTPLEEVLPYNGLDAKYCLKAALVQEELLEKEGLVDIYEMQNVRAGPIVIAQRRGIHPNTPAAKRLNQELEAKQEGLLKKINEDPDAVAWCKENHREFPATSNPELLKFFRNYLGHRDIASVDEPSLSTIDHPISSSLLELRATSKLRSTYVSPLLPGGKQVHEDGLIHTNFNHLLTVTGRLSSDEPNLQNFPNRKGRHIREVIAVPSDDIWLVSIDFGQIEARIIGMASNDSYLMTALWEDYDIHMVWTEKLAYAYPSKVGGKKFLKDKERLKKFRKDVKNQWTFPLFYGSMMSSVSRGLDIPTSIIEPLYDEFWSTFADVYAWQQSLLKRYKQLGYVETLTGRRRHAPLSPNEIINTPIQGTASDIVVDASVRLAKIAYEQSKPQFQYRLNVHDDLTFYFPDRSLEEDIEFAAKHMVMSPLPFITAPLTVEVSIGRNWYEQEEIAVFKSTQFGFKRPTTSR